MTSVHSIVSEPIAGHEDYHMLVWKTVFEKYIYIVFIRHFNWDPQNDLVTGSTGFQPSMSEL